MNGHNAEQPKLVAPFVQILGKAVWILGKASGSYRSYDLALDLPLLPLRITGTLNPVSQFTLGRGAFRKPASDGLCNSFRNGMRPGAATSPPMSVCNIPSIRP